ncbi:hypothetical protein [Octadecabacter ascidiaceicola]|uniref:Uncharacterized protein n=1 Tax=Octadecabacter ascidiaceicola TaxID=1655543 RepID=A0A238JLA9_9RHOB|nr:hypothetical protein [Octadecabacter ascidiaceicola]SMX31183.1 hypothetical protein OCA8868_00232 [Octadecabacter ascidiaceicola]
MQASNQPGFFINLNSHLLLVVVATLMSSCSSFEAPVSIVSPLVLNACSGTEVYSEIEFDFEENWMDEYTFWVEDSAVLDAPAEIGGLRFGRDKDQSATVRMLGGSGSCIFQVETFSLQASSVQLYVETFGGSGGPDPSISMAFDLVRTPDFELDISELVFVGLTVQEEGKGATFYTFVVAGGEILPEE